MCFVGAPAKPRPLNGRRSGNRPGCLLREKLTSEAACGYGEKTAAWMKPDRRRRVSPDMPVPFEKTPMPIHSAASPILDALPADEPENPRPILDALPAEATSIRQPIRALLPVDLSRGEVSPEARDERFLLPRARPTRNPVVLLYRLVRRVVGVIASTMEWLFGAAVLLVGLAVLAALPLLQFLSLGYLLEAGARVASIGTAARWLHRRAPGGPAGQRSDRELVAAAAGAPGRGHWHIPPT